MPCRLSAERKFLRKRFMPQNRLLFRRCKRKKERPDATPSILPFLVTQMIGFCGLCFKHQTARVTLPERKQRVQA
jgi:hypothetical protein